MNFFSFFLPQIKEKKAKLATINKQMLTESSNQLVS